MVFSLDIVNSFKYLGVVFSSDGSFRKAKVEIAKQAEREMYNLLAKCKNLALPIDMKIDLLTKWSSQFYRTVVNAGATEKRSS